MKEKAKVSLRLVEDELHRVGGVLKFPCTVQVIAAVKSARGKYFADVEQQRLAAEKRKSKKSCSSKQKQPKKELEVEANVKKPESDIQVADAIIQKSIKQLEKVVSLTSKHIQKTELQFVLSKIDISSRGKESVMKELTILRKQKKELIAL